MGSFRLASLIVGVAAASTGKPEVLVAGLASLVAGAMSMAAGEFISVSSQSDTEQADLARERRELREDPESELQELTQIYVDRGLDQDLARRVAKQLMAKDALGAHSRDELGISEVVAAKPVQAAITSALTFAAGAALPMIVALAVPFGVLIPAVAAASLVFLAGLGAVGAKTGGASPGVGAGRVLFWGAAAMAATAGIGWLFGTVAA